VADEPEHRPLAQLGGQCEACGKSVSLYVYDNLASGSVNSGDIDTLRAYWRHRAQLWWSARQPQPQPCFACNEDVLPGHGYWRGGNLYCPRCACREGDVERLKSNPHYFGSGELTRARAFIAKPTQDI